MSENKKYCANCGSVKTKIPDGHSFDENTGVRIDYFKLVCPNLLCHSGCGAMGHDYGFGSWRTRCKRCGHVVTSEVW